MVSKSSFVDDASYRICFKCKNRKPSDHFHKKGVRFDSACRACRSAIKKEKYREKKAQGSDQQEAEVIFLADQKTQVENQEKPTTNQPMPSFWSTVYGCELTSLDVESINHRLVSLLKIMEEISKANGKEL